MEPEELKRRRSQLLEAMSGVSEERWCAGWMVDLDRRLFEDGGIWETIGRDIGWPVGDYEAWTWMTWEEATTVYADQDQPGDTVEALLTSLQQFTTDDEGRR